jgi:NitT/TauT family transport system substrate-binding protein
MARMKFFLLSLVLAAAPAAAATPITLSYTVGESVTAFAAKEAGIFDKHGLDVTLLQVTQNSNAPAALASASVEVAMIQVANLLQAADSGLDFVAIAGGSDLAKGVSHNSVVVRTGLQVKSARDLAGHTVGVPGIGASIDIFFRNWLIDNSVSPNRVNIVETTFLAMGDNLKNQTVDAVTPLEPFVTRITKAGLGYELVNLIDTLPRARLNALVFGVTRHWAEEHADAVAALRASIHEADAYVLANPDRAREDINKYTKMPMEILASLPLPAVDETARQADFDVWAHMMQRLNMLQSRPDTAKLILP